MIPRQLLATDSHRPRVNADASGPLILHLPYIRFDVTRGPHPAWESAGAVLAPSKRARANCHQNVHVRTCTEPFEINTLTGGSGKIDLLSLIASVRSASSRVPLTVEYTVKRRQPRWQAGGLLRQLCARSGTCGELRPSPPSALTSRLELPFYNGAVVHGVLAPRRLTSVSSARRTHLDVWSPLPTLLSATGLRSASFRG